MKNEKKTRAKTRASHEKKRKTKMRIKVVEERSNSKSSSGVKPWQQHSESIFTELVPGIKSRYVTNEAKKFSLLLEWQR